MDRPSSSDGSDRSATKRSIQQSLVNRLVHSEHSPVIPGPGNTGTGQTDTQYRDPVTPGIPGTPGQTRCNRSHREHRSHRVHHPHWAILSWACYCRIDPLGLNQNARSVSNRSDRSATKSSVQQSSGSRPVHSEHSPVTPGPRNTGTGQTGTRYRDPVPGAR